MRIDFLQSAISRLAEDSKRPRTPQFEATAKEVILGIEDVNWVDLLKGNILNFGFEPGGPVEKFFVSHNWSVKNEEYSRSRYGGADWPPPRWSGLNHQSEVVVRFVGRGAKYLAALQDDFKKLAVTAPWAANAEQFISAATISNPRARKARATKYLSSIGGTVHGTELQQERTLIARSENGFPLAVWTLGLSMFFPNAIPTSVEDYVPILQIDVLHTWDGDRAWEPDLERAFSAMLSKLVLQALTSIGPSLTAHERYDYLSINLPFAIKIRLPACMENRVSKVCGVLAELFDDNGYCRGLIDSHATVWWLDVEVAQEDVAAQRAEALAAQEAEKEKAAALKSSMLPGDEYTLLVIEPKEFCRGANGRLYPFYLSEIHDTHNEFFEESPAELLDAYGLKADELNRLNWMDRGIACRAAVSEYGNGDEPDEIADLLASAAHLAVVGHIGPAPKLQLFVLKDEATGAQVATLGRMTSSIAKFLRDATTVAEFGGTPAPRPPELNLSEASPLDPGTPTLAAPPRRLKVSRSLVDQYPQIQSWCDVNKVELIHPKSGFDSVGTIARAWHEHLRQGIRESYAPGKKSGATIEELDTWVKAFCFVVNDRPGQYFSGYYHGTKGADSRFIPWRDALVAKARGLNSTKTT